RPPLASEDLIGQRPCTLNRTDRPAISTRNLLRSGTPTAHERGALPLLPSGPGGVRRIPLRGAQPSTPSRTAHSTRPALEREFNPAVADCGLQGTATSPSSTAHFPPVVDKGPSGPFSPTGNRDDRSSIMKLAEGVGFEPTVRLPVHGISSAAPSATRPPLRASPALLKVRSNWRRGEDLNPRGTCAPIRFRVGRLQPGSATPPRNLLSILHVIARSNLRLRIRHVQVLS